MTTYTTRAQLMRVKAWRTIVGRIELRLGEMNSLYFTSDTIKYWSNRWHGLPVETEGDIYWVESYQVFDEPRVYKVKALYMHEHTEYDVSEFPHYPTAEAATDAMRFIAGVKR